MRLLKIKLLISNLVVVFFQKLIGFVNSHDVNHFINNNVSKISETDRFALFRRLLLDGRDSEFLSKDIDLVSNFSAYDRDKWVGDIISKIPAGSKVLDAGAGQCRYKPLLKHAQYFSQDFAQYKGNETGPLVETWDYGELDFTCDIVDIPVDSNSFDTVICTEVLEHVPDPISALKELVRVTSSGGQLIITVPLGSGVHQEPYHFYGGFSPWFFEYYFDKLGVDIVEIRPLGGLLKHVAQEVSRVSRVVEQDISLNINQEFVIKQWLPRWLYMHDAEYYLPQFTVGYLVLAKKK